jgi:hypothetical protein
MTKITLAKFPLHKMAFVLINEKVAYTGNYEDFHAGCHGSHIAGIDLKGKWNRGMDTLVCALKNELEKKDIVQIGHTNLKPAEYNKLMGYKAC